MAARKNGAKISRSTNVLFFRDARTIGRRKLNWHPYSVKREHQAGLCGEGIPARRPGIGLALWGWGSRADSAHPGRAAGSRTESYSLIACIAGTSVGSILGAAYASGAPLARIIAATCRTLKFPAISGSWQVSTVGAGEQPSVGGPVERVFDAKQFDDLRTPNGSCSHRPEHLVEPVVASPTAIWLTPSGQCCAFPGLFEPVKDRHTLPSRRRARRSGSNPGGPRNGGRICVVCVSVGIQDADRGSPSNIFPGVVTRAVSAAQKHQLEVWERYADLVLRPDVQSFAWGRGRLRPCRRGHRGGRSGHQRRALPRIQKSSGARRSRLPWPGSGFAKHADGRGGRTMIRLNGWNLRPLLP